jgi:hypothetical protein
VEDNDDPEGAPPRSMYIDDQAEEDTDTESELSIRKKQEGTDTEKWKTAKPTTTTRI